MPKKLYIIVQTYAENRGSFYGFFEELARYASGKGYKVIIVTGQTGGSKPAFEDLGYADIHRFSVGRPPFLGVIINAFLRARHVGGFFKKNPPEPGDIVISNWEALGVLNRRYSLRAGDQPALAFLRNMEIAGKESSLLSRIARFAQVILQYPIEVVCMRKADAIIYSSEENRKLFVKYYGGKDKPYFIPRSGVNIKDIEKGGKLPAVGPGIKLLFVAPKSERVRKGVMHLEGVLPEIFERFPDAKLLHIGEHMEWRIPERYLTRIVSVGKVPWSGMKDYYKTADLMVSCSLSEGFPNTILEAMAAGTPIVSSDINGITDYIT
ncbi:MAG: glycosyltransferase family 4 protein, partial [Candidatus Altiarchaeota archaeon]|nr:glycosyltransferase family 4 protein [Candidatus Altiarchaeota archaeon]